jgi:hypothetical protein
LVATLAGVARSRAREVAAESQRARAQAAEIRAAFDDTRIAIETRRGAVRITR